MLSFFEKKPLIAVFALIGLTALFVLASGLDDIPFREGLNFDRGIAIEVRNATRHVSNSITTVPLLKQAIIWLLVISIFVLIGFLLKPEIRKRLIQTAIRVAIIYWGLYILATRYQEMRANIGADATDNASSSGIADSPLPAFTSPETLSAASSLISFVVALFLIYLAWKGYQLWKELNQPLAEQPLKKLANIARTSLAEISAGKNSTDVILNCYYRMSAVVEQKQNLRRKEAITPAEFAVQMQSAGLPADAVHRLTALFERVRYGDHRSGSGEVNEAVVCLTTILHHCGEPA